MALRIKLRPWKNRIKKIKMNAKELSLLGRWIKRDRGRNEREREREGEGERDTYMITMITQYPGPLTCRHSKLVGTSRTDWLVQTAQGRE